MIGELCTSVLSWWGPPGLAWDWRSIDLFPYIIRGGYIPCGDPYSPCLPTPVERTPPSTPSCGGRTSHSVSESAVWLSWIHQRGRVPVIRIHVSPCRDPAPPWRHQWCTVLVAWFPRAGTLSLSLYDYEGCYYPTSACWDAGTPA